AELAARLFDDRDTSVTLAPARPAATAFFLGRRCFRAVWSLAGSRILHIHRLENTISPHEELIAGEGGRAVTAQTISGHRTRAVLAVVGLSLMAVVSAVSGLNIALPSLARETGASQTELTWIIDAYTVVFAGLLLFAGALGDRFGRRRLLAVGLL